MPTPGIKAPLKVPENWFLKVSKTPAKSEPNSDTALWISKVAEDSPAQALGLKRGDLLLSVNKGNAQDVDIDEILVKTKRVDYRFYLPNENAVLTVQTHALPLGIMTEMSSAAIFRKYHRHGYYGFQDWLVLWERSDYARLKTCVEHVNKGSFLGKLLGKAKPIPVADLMLGICEIETGDAQVGYDMLETFAARDMAKYTRDVHALVYYYFGVRADKFADGEKFKEQMSMAFECFEESERVKQMAERAGLQIFAQNPLLSRQMPLDYDLEYLEGGKGHVDLRALLAAMPSGQFMPICLMPMYRGNGPYNMAIRAYRSIYPYMQEHLHPLVVMTSTREKRKDRAFWYEQEGLALKSGRPMHVVLESTAKFLDDLRLTGAPSFVVIDKDANIIWDQSLDTGFEYWEMLAQAKTLII